MTKRRPRRTPALEWAAGILGFFITAGLLGFLAAQAIRETTPTPPLLEVEPTGLYRQGGRYIMEVEIRNSSHRTGAGVGIEARLGNGATAIETSSTTVSYVPGDSHRKAGLVFTRDPREHQIQLRVTGYELP